MEHIRSSLLSTAKQALAQQNIQPTKGLGQNFLIDGNAIHKLIGSAQIEADDTVLEIGPGTGILTLQLAKIAKHVIAIEKDARMVELLQKTFAHSKNVQIIHGDALKTNYTRYNIQDTKYKVVANLPYYITAPIIRKFLEEDRQPKSLTFIIQKEVARRICAKPPKMSLLAVSVQFYATPKIVSTLKKDLFWPRPNVDAAIIHIVPSQEKSAVDPKQFFRVVKAGFLHPRKQLLNNLSSGLHLTKEQSIALLKEHDIQPTRRAETLSQEEWGKLSCLVS
jgi:16S rRNA (adenine1518-N6/adenine1519-N6)-dimethyltransferase